MELNRRDFLKGSLAFGGVAALSGLAGCAAPQQASDGQAKDAEPENAHAVRNYEEVWQIAHRGLRREYEILIHCPLLSHMPVYC